MRWRQTTPAGEKYLDDAVSASAVSVLHFFNFLHAAQSSDENSVSLSVCHTCEL